MTAVSLSIVFGPSVFQCGGGLEGLKQQGHTNAVLCRLVKNCRVLFEVTSEPEKRSKVKKKPARPEPYSEYIKKLDSPGETSFSERSVDEAIEQSDAGRRGAEEEERRGAGGAGGGGGGGGEERKQEEERDHEREEEEEAEEEEIKPVFVRRQPVKKERRVRFRSSSASSADDVSKQNKMAGGHASTLPSRISVSKQPTKNSRERENSSYLSPFSLHDSPPGSLSSSSSITPHSSKVVSTAIESSVNKYLFGPSSPTHPSSSSSPASPTGRANSQSDVYSLLLPNKTDSPTYKTESHQPTLTAPLTHDGHAIHDIARNITATSTSPQTNTENVSLRKKEKEVDKNSQSSEANVHVVADGSTTIRVAGLIQKFNDAVDGEECPSPPKDVPQKRKPMRKEFEIFEKTGMIMGMSKPMTQSSISHTSPPHTSPRHTSPPHTSPPPVSKKPVKQQLAAVTDCEERGGRGKQEGREEMSRKHEERKREREKRKEGEEKQTEEIMEAGREKEGGGEKEDLRSTSAQDTKEPGTSTGHTHILKHLTKSRPKGPSKRRLPTAHSRVTMATKREDQEERKEKDRSEKVEGRRERKEREGMLSRLSAQTNQTSRNEAPDHIHKTTPTSTSHAIIEVAPMEHERALQGWMDRDTEEDVSSEIPHALPTHTLTTDTLTTHTLSVPLSNEELIYRIQDLKQEIQDFETSFVEKHNYKPTHSDKEPIREQLEELTRLRLQRKQTKQLMETGREKRGKEERNRLTSTRGVTVSASHHSELRSIDTISAREEVKEHNSSQVRSQQTKKIQGEHATCSPPSLTASTTTAARSRQDVRNSTASPSLLQISPSTSPLPHSTYPPLLQSSAISSTDSATSTANATTVTTTHTTATTTSTVGTTTVTIDSATATIGSATGTTGTIADGSRSNLEQKLKKIMASLSEKRRKAGRPAELKNMTHSQVLDEKQMVQRVLLHFEKIHGRPSSSADKDTMRPLYDHYRQVKRLLAIGVTSGEETMASITLLQSGLANSLPTGLKHPSSREPELFHSALGVRSSRLTTAPRQRAREMEERERGKEKDGGKESDKEKDSEREREREMVRDRREREKREQESVTQVVRTERPMLKEATVIELYHLQESTLAEKKKIRKVLKDFESQFLLEHNRAVSKADRGPYQKEYSQYKAVKESLSLIANEINKRKLYQNFL